MTRDPCASTLIGNSIHPGLRPEVRFPERTECSTTQVCGRPGGSPNEPNVEQHGCAAARAFSPNEPNVQQHGCAAAQAIPRTNRMFNNLRRVPRARSFSQPPKYQALATQSGDSIRHSGRFPERTECSTTWVRDRSGSRCRRVGRPTKARAGGVACHPEPCRPERLSAVVMGEKSRCCAAQHGTGADRKDSCRTNPARRVVVARCDKARARTARIPAERTQRGASILHGATWHGRGCPGHQ